MRTLFRSGLLVVVSLFAGCSLIWPAEYKLREAEELENKGQYAEAAVLYELVFTKYPKSRQAIDALSRAAAVYEERLGNWQKAAAYLQDLRARTEGKPVHASVLLRLGRVLEHAGTPFRDSLETYGVLCKNCASAPEAVSALVAQGRLHESMQNWVAAKGVYEEALARYGKSAEAPTIRVRLEAVWQFEATGLYYAGEVEHGVTIAEEALKKGVTVDEVRNGLEALLMRHRNARNLWQAEAASVVRQEAMVLDAPPPGHFIHRYERSATPIVPSGWTVSFDAKKKALSVAEAPPEPEPPAEIRVTATSSGKPAIPKTPKPRPKTKAWTWKSPAGTVVLGWWFSPDGRHLCWLGKSREGRKRSLNLIDLGMRKGWVVIGDPAGTVLGEVMAFLPHSNKMLIPYRDMLMVTDFRGGNQTSFPMIADRNPRARFKGRQVDWISTTADGLEVLIAVTPTAPTGKGFPAVEPKAQACWKVGLGVASF